MLVPALHVLWFIIGLSPPPEGTEKQENVEKETPRPRLIAAPHHDMGSVYSGQEIHFDYVLRNEGNVPLVIREVRTTCGCTVVRGFDREIQPGKTGKLPVKVDTKGLNGRLEKKVILTTNDPKRVSAELGIKGLIKPLVEKSPKSGASLGRVRQNQKVKSTVRLKNVVDRPLKLEMLPFDSPQFSARLRRLKKGQEYALEIQFDAPEKPGSYYETVELKTDFPGVPILPIRCSAVVAPRIEARPPKVMLPKAVSRPVKRFVYLNEHGGGSLKLLKASCDDERIEIETQSTEAGYQLTLSFPKNYRTQSQGTVLRLETNDEEFGTLEVPIRTLGTSPPVARFDESYGLPIRVEPPAISMDAGLSKDAVTRTIRLYNVSKKKAELSVLESGGERYDVELTTVEENRVYDLKVTIKAPVPLGASQATIEIGTNFPEMPLVTIPCSVMRESHVEVRPSKVILNSLGDQTSFANVVIRSRLGRDLKVLSAKIDHPKIQVSVEPRDKKGESIVKLVLPKGFPASTKPFHLMIRTDEPEFEEISVPVRVKSRKQTRRGRFGLRPPTEKEK